MKRGGKGQGEGGEELKCVVMYDWTRITPSTQCVCLRLLPSFLRDYKQTGLEVGVADHHRERGMCERGSGARERESEIERERVELLREIREIERERERVSARERESK